MSDPRLEDHVVGLELQLVELVEQQHLARTQYRPDEAARLESQIAAIQAELAASAEAAILGDAPTAPSDDGQPHADVLAPTVGEVVRKRSAPDDPVVGR
ncbi:MAG TPA: hypothetical protein VHS52_05875 [Acidimicrobiales bacterium]|jgi:biotin carboxyl carrier protein|nr:hypothetical protein [Acidimicrobiales bacterium]